jgi:hypothetical protein
MPKFDATDLTALRACARLCWQRREQLALTSQEREQVLIAWMAIGGAEEGEAASEALQALRSAESQQRKFDQLLSQT